MKKKSLLLSLACAMLILLFGMTANAQSEDTLEPYSYTNPAYANLESGDVSDNIAPYSMEDTPNISYTDDVDALASTLRQQMVSRAAVINLYYHHDSVLTQAVFDQLCDDLFRTYRSGQRRRLYLMELPGIYRWRNPGSFLTGIRI